MKALNQLMKLAQKLHQRNRIFDPYLNGYPNGSNGWIRLHLNDLIMKAIPLRKHFGICSIDDWMNNPLSHHCPADQTDYNTNEELENDHRLLEAQILQMRAKHSLGCAKARWLDILDGCTYASTDGAGGRYNYEIQMRIHLERSITCSILAHSTYIESIRSFYTREDSIADRIEWFRRTNKLF